MITIYAEKPSVGRAIATALGDTKKCDGYMEVKGSPYVVTWGFGHLCTLKDVEMYEPNYKNWRNRPVPYFPEKYELCLRDDSVSKQVATIKSLFDKSDYIVNATDYDREGEIIFAYLYEFLKCSKPCERVKIVSQTKKGILSGIKDVIHETISKNIENAGRARSIADWVVGTNLTVFASLRYSGGSGVLKIGRVQTPTLNMVVQRELAITGFASQKFFTLDAIFKKATGESFAARRTNGRFDEQPMPLLSKLTGKNGIVESIEVSKETSLPPLLYSLSALQSDANTAYGFTLQQTLDIAQALYEKAMITYPRTDSRYLTDDMKPQMKKLLAILARNTRYKALLGSNEMEPHGWYFNSEKVNSHYAIIPTGKLPEKLSKEEMQLYTLIADSAVRTAFPAAEMSPSRKNGHEKALKNERILPITKDFKIRQ